MAILPDVPTAAEAGLPGFEASSWFALVAPAGTPKEIVAKLNAEAAKILTRSQDGRAVRPARRPAGRQLHRGVHAFIPKERARWAEIVKASGVKLE